MGCGKSSVEPKSTDDIIIQPKVINTRKIEASKPALKDNKEISTTPTLMQQKSIKMILLGPSECGKTTFKNHLRIKKFDDFKINERKEMSHSIKKYLIENIKILIEAIQSSGKKSKHDFSFINDLQSKEINLTPEIGQKIESIWDDSSIRSVYKRIKSTKISENSSFFFENAESISKPNYLPINDDILKCFITTTASTTLQFQINNSIPTELLDVGGKKSDRESWVTFTDIDYVIYFVSLSDFDQFLLEDQKTKRTADSLTLFNNIMNSPQFNHKPVFLILNKTDLFEEKLKKSPQKFIDAYPNFNTDTKDVKACIEYVKKRFLSELPSNRDSQTEWVEVLTINALDDKSVLNAFQKISEKVVETVEKPPKPPKIPQIPQPEKKSPRKTAAKPSPRQKERENKKAEAPKNAKSPRKPSKNQPQTPPSKGRASNKKVAAVKGSEKYDPDEEITVYEYVSEYVTDFDSYTEYEVSESRI